MTISAIIKKIRQGNVLKVRDKSNALLYHLMYNNETRSFELWHGNIECDLQLSDSDVISHITDNDVYFEAGDIIFVQKDSALLDFAADLTQTYNKHFKE